LRGVRQPIEQDYLPSWFCDTFYWFYNCRQGALSLAPHEDRTGDVEEATSDGCNDMLELARGGPSPANPTVRNLRTGRVKRNHMLRIEVLPLIFALLGSLSPFSQLKRVI
jgi:hypothetical protein